MANPDILIPFILSWEGGFVNHPKDPGGPTNRGVTISTWRAQGYDKDGDGDIDVDDLKLITDADATVILKKNYWDRWKADGIESQSVANLLVDWVWASGVHGITKPQMLLGVAADGVVGPKTIGALNALIRNKGGKYVFNMIFARRQRFIESCRNFDVFGRGWLNRLKSIGFESLTLNKFTTQGGRRIPVIQTFHDNA